MAFLKRLLLAIMIICTVTAAPLMAEVSDMAKTLLQAADQNKPIPLISLRSPNVDVDTAYAVQKAYVTRRLMVDRFAGFKAGLTSVAGQKRFGVDAPLAGVLFESGRLTGSPTIDARTFGKLMVETEIGFVIGKTISRPVKDVKTLQGYVHSVMPVIELPDLGFDDMKRLKGVDIIAADVAARQFIIGREQLFQNLDLNSVVVTLSLNGQAVNTGHGSDAMGNQWQAARWLINTMVNQGWAVEAGHLIITGALGKMLPGKPGHYVADYGAFGKIEFEIQ